MTPKVIQSPPLRQILIGPSDSRPDASPAALSAASRWGRAAVFDVVQAGPFRGLCRRAGVELGRTGNINQRLLMSTPILDPSLPADNSPLVSGEMRGQFQAIQNNFDDLRARLIALTPLGLTVSNPPTQADVQAIADKLDELINALSA